MIRTKLTALIVALVLLVGAAAAALVVKTSQLAFHVERGRLAHDTLEAHLSLSIETYRLFKQSIDALLTGESANRVQIEDAADRFDQALRTLRERVAGEVGHIDDDEDELAGELGELERISALQREVDGIIRQLDLLRSSAHSDPQAAFANLSAVLDGDIDRRFNTLMEEAIADEREEVEAADLATQRVLERSQPVAFLVGGLAVVLAIGGGYWVQREVRRPMDSLMGGIGALRRGDLEHRIDVDCDNEFDAVAAAFNDMADDMKRQREALEAARGSLAAEVDARTLELAEANEALQQVDSVRRRLFADISHELRTPLTIIRGESEIALRTGGDSDSYEESLKRVLDQASQLQRLVDDLLFIARNDSDTVRIERKPVDMAIVFAKTRDQLRGLAGGDHKALQIEMPDLLPRVMGDEMRLVQLFTIIIDNAFRHSNASEQVEMCARLDGRELIVDVIDNGVGIAEDELPYVFERLYRGHSTGAGGLGLGLPIAKTITEAHGGRIAIISGVGEGTTVSVILPIMGRMEAAA